MSGAQTMTSAESTAVTLESSSGVPPMWFVAPEGFHALPVDASPEEMAERLYTQFFGWGLNYSI